MDAGAFGGVVMQGEDFHFCVHFRTVDFLPSDEVHALGGPEKWENLDAKWCEDQVSVPCQAHGCMDQDDRRGEGGKCPSRVGEERINIPVSCGGKHRDAHACRDCGGDEKQAGLPGAGKAQLFLRRLDFSCHLGSIGHH